MELTTATKGQQIRTIVLDTPWMTRKEIAAQVGCTVARVGEIVRAMTAGSVEEQLAVVRLNDHRRIVTAARPHDVIAC